MELTVLNKDFIAITILDSFESIIWTDRYDKAGDFEIFTPVTKYLLDNIKKDFYLVYGESEHIMIIESIEISSDSEEGDKLIIRGRSLESILERRIIWSQTVIEGNLQTGIKKLINDAIIQPTDQNRKIDNFIFEDSTDTAVTGLSISGAQYTGDNLYDVVNSLCEDNNIGFKITLNDEFKFVFKLYSGVDRSYDQDTNPYVIFSRNFENIVNSDYIESNESYKTVTLILGEGEGSNRKSATVGAGSGLERRELFTDARDISSTVSGGTLTAAQYTAQLEQRGKEALATYKLDRYFDGQVEASRLFRYGNDFFLGDLVHLVDSYDNDSKARITEIIRSQSGEGFLVYPSFKMMDPEQITNDTSKTYIYKRGSEYLGGLETLTYSIHGYNGFHEKSGALKTPTYISLTANADADSQTVGTAQKIDLTNYNKLYAIITENNTEYVLEIDVSSYTTSYYISMANGREYGGICNAILSISTAKNSSANTIITRTVKKLGSIKTFYLNELWLE